MSRRAYTRIIGVDPGGRTGIAILEFVEGETVFMSMEKDYKSAMHWLYRTVNADDVLAVERYVVTSRTARLSNQLAAPEVIGVCRCLSIVRGAKLIEQSPSDAKTVWPNRRLNEIPFTAGKVRGDHARDATRHALLAARRRGMLTAIPGSRPGVDETRGDDDVRRGDVCGDGI